MRIVTVQEAAEALGMSAAWVRNQMNAKRFRCLRVGRRVLVDLDEILAVAGFDQHMLNAKQAADLTGIDANTIRNWIRTGRLPAIRDTGGRRGRFHIRTKDLMPLAETYRKKSRKQG